MTTSKKPSSAPARISAKDDIWKDIHDWAKPSGSRGEEGEGHEGEGTAMIGSQLKDNVTEQRMLEGRLMDLSKERYKFIVQVAWQRKAFVDRQKAKTGVMKDLLNGIDTSQVASGKGTNYNARMHVRHDTYKNLALKTYAEGHKSNYSTSPQTQKAEYSEDGLLEMKPIFPNPTHPIFKTEIPSSSGSQRFNQARHMMLDRRKAGGVSFPSLDANTGGGGSRVPVRGTRSHGLITQRQSMPATFLRRDVHKMTAQLGDLRETKSASCIPKYLKYRAVYDGRFNRLEKVLCKPYTGAEMDSMRSLLRTLPPAPSTSPAPAGET
ncbi:uncharacterized protein LOC119734819 [Patiria miniata]|uniref:Uncharacterized protein n=1 Tax=Patiria miniata TaxID=46514 RepID=A0A914AK14_PATMI|nr:uncharacterized protein LOC119734819 [Patiria miniata]XP_038064321.1 uncharacterized protein LOC119734819 [Patiria miniata]